MGRWGDGEMRRWGDGAIFIKGCSADLRGFPPLALCMADRVIILTSYNTLVKPNVIGFN
ncbi:MAG: hypothetical protein F6K52_14190 [Moorea sp. SIO3H5]|nr:hypothetical protein [Moorena sp. SIO3H5]